MPSRQPVALPAFDRKRRRIALVLPIVLAAAAATTTLATPVTAVPVGATAPRTMAQAAAQARQSGTAVVATDTTTPISQTIANPDGTFTTVESAAPTRVLRNGTWVQLDPTLIRAADGSYSPAATTAHVRLSAGGAGPLAVLDSGGHELTLTFPMALPAPTVAGHTATYPNVLSNVDLVVSIDEQGGFSDTLVVHTADAAANPDVAALRIGTTSRDLSVAADAGGNITVADPAGHAAYTAPTPMMWDSATTTSTTSVARPAVSTSTTPGDGAHEAPVAVSAGGQNITLTPSQTLLTASSTVFPVYIDPIFHPDFYGGTADWTEVESNVTTYAGWHQSGPEQVGDCAWSGCNGIGATRSYFQWSITPLYGATIINSQVNFTEQHVPSCTLPAGHNGTVWLEWTYGIGTGTNWNNKPGIIATIGSNGGMYGFDSSCPATGIGWDVTPQVASSVNSRSGTTTFGLQAGDEGDPYDWKQFANTALFSTTYDFAPVTPTQTWTSPVTACGTTAPYPMVGKTDLYLAVNTRLAADNVVKPLGVEFKVTPIGGTTPAFDQTINTSAGSWAGATVPMNTLATGDYSWTTRVDDGSLKSGWSAPCDIHEDTSQPGKPGISSTDYPNTVRGKVVGTPGTFTFTPDSGSPTPAGYRYQLNSGAPITVPATNGSWTGTITPNRVSPTSLTVQALSPAGNPGAAAQWQIVPQPLPAPLPSGDIDGDGKPDLLTVGGTGGTAAGLWLAPGDGTGKVTTPYDFGIRGAGLTPSSSQPSDWNGALVTTGQFTGDKMQDVLAVLAGGTTEIYANPGDGSALDPDSGSQSKYGLDGSCFIDPSWQCLTSTEVITQITAIGHLPTDQNTDSGTAYPDLLAVVNVGGRSQLWLFEHGDGTGNYDSIAAYVLDPGTSIDWSTKTITGTVFNGRPALLVRDTGSTHNGEVDLYPTCTTSGCTGANGWFADAQTVEIPNVQPSGTAITAPVLASSDANGNGTMDLWTVDASGNAKFLPGSPTGALGTETAAGVDIPPVSTNLTAAGAVTWTNPTTNQIQTDVYTIDAAGNLWDNQREPSTKLGPPIKVGTGWHTMTVFGVVDWNHDGYPDIVARNNNNCQEDVFPGSPTGFAGTAIQVGSGWCGLTPFGIEDWYENGHFGVVAREDSTGNLWFYPGDLSGGDAPQVQIGAGFTAGTYDPVGIIDFNGDGHNDVIVRYEPTNILKMYPGDGKGGGWPSGGSQLGAGFNGHTFFGLLYYNGSTTEPDLISRQPNTGNVRLYRGNGTGGWADAGGTDIIANGW
jgi:hypothetical protein